MAGDSDSERRSRTINRCFCTLQFSSYFVFTMAVSSGVATTLAAAKMEAFLLNTSFPSASSSGSPSSLRAYLATSQLKINCSRSRNKSSMLRGGLRFDITAASSVEDGVVETADTRIGLDNVSSQSALEQLKTSAADSEFFFF